MSTDPNKDTIASMDEDDERRRIKRLNRDEKLAPITKDDISFMEPKSSKESEKDKREESLERSLKPVPEPHSKT